MRGHISQIPFFVPTAAVLRYSAVPRVMASMAASWSRTAYMANFDDFGGLMANPTGLSGYRRIETNTGFGPK